MAIEKYRLVIIKFSPFLSAANYEAIQRETRTEVCKVIPLQPKTNWSQYVGWAAAIVLLVGIGFQYNQLDQTTSCKCDLEKAKIEKI
jgi:hypothetical protein